MTIKQLKRRVVQGLVEPELFYMPWGKKEETPTEQCNNLTIGIYLYNTLNVDTMEYSNTEGLVATRVRSHIIITDKNGNLFFNSKRQFDNQNNSNPASFFRLTNVPYGIYQVKIIYTEGTGVVDNQTYNLIVDKQEVALKLYLKYYWVTETLCLDKGSVNSYVSGNTFEVSDLNIKSYWGHINVTDDENEGILLCTVPYPNGFIPLFETLGSSQTYGNYYGYLYSDKKCEEYAFSYKLTYYFREGGSQTGTVIDQKAIRKGKMSSEIIDNAYLSLVNSNFEYTTCLRQMYHKLATNYENSSNVHSQRLNHLTCTQHTDSYIRYNDAFYRSWDDSDDGYVYNDVNNLSNLSYNIRNAWYYYHNNSDSIQNIDEKFFLATNFLIYEHDGMVGSIYTWDDYIKTIEKYKDDTSFSIIKKCARYDLDKFYLSPQVIVGTYENYEFESYGLRGLYNYRGHYFNFNCDKTQIISSSNNSAYVLGYVKFGEDTKDKSIRHIICTTIPTYSEDYDQY